MPDVVTSVCRGYVGGINVEECDDRSKNTHKDKELTKPVTLFLKGQSAQCLKNMFWFYCFTCFLFHPVCFGAGYCVVTWNKSAVGKISNIVEPDGALFVVLRVSEKCILKEESTP